MAITRIPPAAEMAAVLLPALPGHHASRGGSGSLDAEHWAESLRVDVKEVPAPCRDTMGCGASSATTARAEVYLEPFASCARGPRLPALLIHGLQMRRRMRRCSAVAVELVAVARFQGQLRAVAMLSARTSTQCPQAGILEAAILEAAILAPSTASWRKQAQ